MELCFCNMRFLVVKTTMDEVVLHDLGVSDYLLVVVVNDLNTYI